MKLIDVLVMISKGELKEGTRIKDLSYNSIWILKNKYGHNWLVDEENICYLDAVYSINNEVELIEPECISNMEKTSEPTDNTTEKIEELVADEINGKSLAEALSIIGGKLNEVIRYINKEG